MGALIVNEADAAANSRLTAIRLATLTLRCLENWRGRLGDYDSAMILVAVVAVTSDRLTRTGLEEDLRDLRSPVPSAKLGRCSISSIAGATGINRESARRKVNRLIELGFLQRRSDGSIAFVPGLLQEATTLELVRKQLDSVTRFSNDLLREGVLQYRA